MTEGLSRIDSAVAGLSISPKDEKVDKKADKAEKKTHRRASSAAEGVRNINDLGNFHGRWCGVGEADCLPEKEQIPLEIDIETQKLGWCVTAPCQTSSRGTSPD
jgi:hypothetical protein